MYTQRFNLQPRTNISLLLNPPNYSILSQKSQYLYHILKNCSNWSKSGAGEGSRTEGPTPEKIAPTGANLVRVRVVEPKVRLPKKLLQLEQIWCG